MFCEFKLLLCLQLVQLDAIVHIFHVKLFPGICNVLGGLCEYKSNKERQGSIQGRGSEDEGKKQGAIYLWNGLITRPLAHITVKCKIRIVTRLLERLSGFLLG